MDIQVLLWLQQLRESLPSFVTSFFLMVSEIAISPRIVLVPCIIFWCVNKRMGKLVVFGFAMGSLLVQGIKTTMCVYRPWVRSTQIHPVENALESATGYSFPSGHTQAATSLVGSIAVYAKEMKRVFAVLCWVFVVLVGISRMYLGVHTPQDVLVGLAIGIGCMLAAEPLLNWAESEGNDVKLLVIASVLSAAFVAYVILKPYPVEYVDGTLLVDPAEMKTDALGSVGMFIGVALGWFIESRYLGFADGVSTKQRAIRVAVGAVVVLAMRYGLPIPLKGFCSPLALEFAKNFFTTFGAVYLAPLAFSTVERSLNT